MDHNLLEKKIYPQLLFPLSTEPDEKKSKKNQESEEEEWKTKK